MTKAKDTADAERQARRRRLEALRDDCRRHDQCAVKIVIVEIGRGPMPEAARLSAIPFPERWICRALQDGRMIEMALWGGEEKAEKNSVAYLARLGRELAELRVPSVCDFPNITDLAMFELAARARAVKSWVPPTMPLQLPPMPETRPELGEGEVRRMIEESWKQAGFIEKIEREVPDVRAAIAEVCDEMLEDFDGTKAESKRTRDSRKVDELTMQAVTWTALQLKRTGRFPLKKEVAEHLGISDQRFSKTVAKQDGWKRLEASEVRDRREER
jgi:hypothetical protein